MKRYRTFSIDDNSAKLKGTVELRLDDEDSNIFKKLKELGMKFTRRKYFVDWSDDTYIEIINKKTYETEAFMELCYR